MLQLCFPLAAMVAAVAIVKVSRASALFSIFVVACFWTDEARQLTPWVAWNPSGLIHFGKYSVGLMFLKN